ncbi:MAG: hypothetical protein DRN15_10205 [Thermoprotei archaeon]|nr:MAG: hypothetical protein DRN15_10205 [Thermoprotei archaeon]
MLLKRALTTALLVLIVCFTILNAGCFVRAHDVKSMIIPLRLKVYARYDVKVEDLVVRRGERLDLINITNMRGYVTLRIKDVNKGLLIVEYADYVIEGQDIYILDFLGDVSILSLETQRLDIEVSIYKLLLNKTIYATGNIVKFRIEKSLSRPPGASSLVLVLSSAVPILSPYRLRSLDGRLELQNSDVVGVIGATLKAFLSHLPEGDYEVELVPLDVMAPSIYAISIRKIYQDDLVMKAGDYFELNATKYRMRDTIAFNITAFALPIEAKLRYHDLLLLKEFVVKDPVFKDIRRLEFLALNDEFRISADEDVALHVEISAIDLSPYDELLRGLILIRDPVAYRAVALNSRALEMFPDFIVVARSERTDLEIRRTRRSEAEVVLRLVDNEGSPIVGEEIEVEIFNISSPSSLKLMRTIRLKSTSLISITYPISGLIKVRVKIKGIKVLESIVVPVNATIDLRCALVPITVRVCDSKGSLVKDVQLCLLDARTRSIIAIANASPAIFESVPQGVYYLIVKWRDLLTHEKLIEVTPSSRDFNIVLPLYSVVIKVFTNEAEPLPAANLTLEGLDSSIKFRGLSNSSGIVVFNRVPSGSYKLIVMWKERTVYSEELRIESDLTKVIVCEVYRLTIRVSGQFGQPIMNALVKVLDQEGNIVAQERANEKGVVILDYLPSGVYTVEATLGGVSASEAVKVPGSRMILISLPIAFTIGNIVVSTLLLELLVIIAIMLIVVLLVRQVYRRLRSPVIVLE